MGQENYEVHGWVDPKRIPLGGGQFFALPADIHAASRTLEAASDRTIEATCNDRNYRELVASRARARGDMQAAADIMDNGAVVVPRFQAQITDLVRRRGTLGQRIETTPATGQPSRYIEQRAIVTGGWVDPRLLAPTAGSPLRAERNVTIKCISAQTNFGLMDVELARQQGGQFDLAAKDIEDMVSGVLKTADIGLWQGTDTDLMLPTTLQYVGLLTQINLTASCDSGTSIIDTINLEIATMMESQSFAVRPTALCAQPSAIARIVQEERQNQRQVSMVDVRDSENRVIGNIQVPAIATVAGVLPLIDDWAIGAPVTPSATEGAGKTDYIVAILTEKMIEEHFVTSADPRLFVLGLQNNLATQYVCVKFSAVVAKGKADILDPEVTPLTYAHCILTFVR